MEPVLKFLLSMALVFITMGVLIKFLDPLELLRKSQDFSLKTEAQTFIIANNEYYAQFETHPWTETFSQKPLSQLDVMITSKLFAQGLVNSNFRVAASRADNLLVSVDEANRLEVCFYPQSNFYIDQAKNGFLCTP